MKKKKETKRKKEARRKKAHAQSPTRDQKRERQKNEMTEEERAHEAMEKKQAIRPGSEKPRPDRCVVCDHTFRMGDIIKGCSFGHTLCAACIQSGEICPECGDRRVTHRQWLMETIIQRKADEVIIGELTNNCPYCQTYMAKKGQMLRHRLHCPMKHYPCPGQRDASMTTNGCAESLQISTGFATHVSRCVGITEAQNIENNVFRMELIPPSKIEDSWMWEDATWATYRMEDPKYPGPFASTFLRIHNDTTANALKLMVVAPGSAGLRQTTIVTLRLTRPYALLPKRRLPWERATATDQENDIPTSKEARLRSNVLPWKVTERLEATRTPLFSEAEERNFRRQLEHGEDLEQDYLRQESMEKVLSPGPLHHVRPGHPQVTGHTMTISHDDLKYYSNGKHLAMLTVWILRTPPFETALNGEYWNTHESAREAQVEADLPRTWTTRAKRSTAETGRKERPTQQAPRKELPKKPERGEPEKRVNLEQATPLPLPVPTIRRPTVPEIKEKTAENRKMEAELARLKEWQNSPIKLMSEPNLVGDTITWEYQVALPPRQQAKTATTKTQKPPSSGQVPAQMWLNVNYE